MNGKHAQKNTLEVFQTNKLALAGELLLLFLLGSLAMLLHAKFRIPMKLPGHHGVELLAILVISRTFSKLPIASTISGLGVAAALFIPYLGFRDPFMAFVFIVPCIAMDILYNIKIEKKAIVVGIIGALAHVTIPLTRFVIQIFTGYKYGSLLTGLAYPVVTYLIFGFTGAILGYYLYKGFKKIKDK